MNLAKPIKTIRVDYLKVKIYSDRPSLGAGAAHDFSMRMKSFSKNNFPVRMIFAAAPSQDEFLGHLTCLPGLPWDKVTAFHMDEYLDLPDNDPALFRKYLEQAIFSKVHAKQVHFLEPYTDPGRECIRYSKLLIEEDIHMVAMGIGENGHIAFNDPPMADFNDPDLVKIVKLEERCRLQQVHDKSFRSLEEVPEKAITLTIPSLMRGKSLFCMVPGNTKSEAVQQVLRGPIDPAWPASILRRHPDATLYLDKDSAGLIL